MATWNDFNLNMTFDEFKVWMQDWGRANFERGLSTDNYGRQSVTGGTDTTSVIALETIKTANIGDLQVSTAKIALAAIVEALIQDLAVTNAKIANLSADKLDAGTINTALVSIRGALGKLTLTGNLLKVMDASDKKRVALGDVKEDGSIYGLELYGADGTTVLLNADGITGDGIPNGVITYAQLSDYLQNAIDFIAAGKAIYYQPLEPTGGTYAAGDLWFDTDAAYAVYEYSGTAWVARTADSAAYYVTYMVTGLLNAGIITADHINAVTLIGTKIYFGNSSAAHGELYATGGVTYFDMLDASLKLRLRQTYEGWTCYDAAGNVLSFVKSDGTFNLGGKITYDGDTLTLDPDAVKLAVGGIGGTNLIKNSTGIFGTTNWYTETPSGGWISNEGYNDDLCFKLVSSSSGNCSIFSNFFFIEPETKYTFSFWSATDGGTDTVFWSFDGGANYYSAAITAGFTTMTLTTPVGATEGRVVFRKGATVSGNLALYVWKVMYQEGDKATNWAPCPSEFTGTGCYFDGEKWIVGTPDGARSEQFNDNGLPVNDLYDSAGNKTRLGVSIANKTVTVGSGKTYATPALALAAQPLFENHSLIIDCYTGTYGSVALPPFLGKGTVTIQQHSGETVSFANFSATSCQCAFVLSGITTTNTDGPGFTITECRKFGLNNCACTASGGAVEGAYILNSFGNINGGTYSNRGAGGILATAGSIVSMSDVAGTGNGIGVYASGAFIIDQGGNTITGTTPRLVGEGGAIIPSTGQGAWTSWTPTVTPGGSMTFTGATINLARYCQVGNIVYYRIKVSGTIGGTPSSYFDFTVSVNRSGTEAYEYAGSGRVTDGADSLAFVQWSNTSQSTIRMMKYNGANYTAGAGAQITLEGFYEV